MRLDDYIRGARSGREAHDLELEAMLDPLLGDALDGFDAVPGNHSASLERLAERVRASASEGRAAARSRSARVRERRVRGWSVAAAAVFLLGAVGGGVWLLRDGVSSDATRGADAGRTDRSVYAQGEVEAILPPVTVIKNEAAPLSAPTEMSDVRLSRDEVRDLSDAYAAVPARDTAVTAEFRRYIRDRTTVPNAAPVTLSFEVGADLRPRNITVTDSPAGSPEAADAAVELLKDGPDWPREPRLKLITINP